ncbi:4-aminobutyrate aminotransferase [Salipiger aestuarii]|uniref:4-aminobutyrate aminotransferase-like enzyme n=1 Tax=Salipiger aestuarii TaxID=568098 RepID=A0A327YKM0_9RHOB|nr:aspartate aminotransferase family protein [Salipiger aestuarii]KAB2542870.1 4-aminobutyrate aminotransferase [Salipiger aestuarii]RAK20786.1 4-aminobutyrate aminotransferase-like enzyme [Salipiger aestuarii]
MSTVRPILDMNAFDASNGAKGAVGRRLANLGAASVLFYREPIQMVSAKGAWMTAADGTRYLDFYNNVPSVGHSHAAVVEALSAQIATLNTNARYVVSVVDDYIEALKARLPDALSNVVLTCSGSEANDLALRIAFAATGRRGVIVTRTAYHGNTALVTDVSPSALKRGAPPDWVETVPAPGREAYRDDIAGGFSRAVRDAMARLDARGHGTAALLVDSIFSSDGIFADPAGFLHPAAKAVQTAGGLVIADEVQPGFARTGAAFWGFQRHGIAPDIVTMGKPMGNGFPMAGLAARPAHLADFCATTGYFNTFGGNPVAAAAGHAVLRVIEREALQRNALDVGALLLDGLRGIAAGHERITQVRGAGLFLGVDLGDAGAPDAAFTTQVIDRMRDQGVLIGAAGRYGATLKLRPPLCLTTEEAARFLDIFERAVSA